MEENSIASLQESITPLSRNLEDVTARIRSGLDRYGLPGVPVGIGVPAFFDPAREVLRRATNFPAWQNIPLKNYWEEALQRPVRLENDANCYALGEGFVGEARGMTDYVVLTLGTGIGGGLVTQGRLIKGFHGMGGETGHIWTHHSQFCAGGCGGQGHLESLAGADGIVRTAREKGLSGEVKELWNLRQENPLVSGLWEEVLLHLAGAIASLMHILDPQAVILGGGISQAEGLQEILEEKTKPLLAAAFRDVLDIRISSLGARAPLFGAASLWLQPEV